MVLGAGLWLAAALGVPRPLLVATGIALVACLVVLTRWEPSVLRVGVMAVLVLPNVKLIRYNSSLNCRQNG